MFSASPCPRAFERVSPSGMDVSPDREALACPCHRRHSESEQKIPSGPWPWSPSSRGPSDYYRSPDFAVWNNGSDRTGIPGSRQRLSREPCIIWQPDRGALSARTEIPELSVDELFRPFRLRGPLRKFFWTLSSGHQKQCLRILLGSTIAGPRPQKPRWRDCRFTAVEARSR